MSGAHATRAGESGYSLSREDWGDLTRDLDWELSYVTEADVFPDVLSGTPWLPSEAWRDWSEPFRTNYPEYVRGQARKETSVDATCELLGRPSVVERLQPAWLGGIKMHAALLPLAEFAATVGNLRVARFGRNSSWRTMALFGALDECRHTQIPLKLMHELVRWDRQFDWAHKFYHTDCWVAIAARRFFDELLLGSDALEFAIATNFVFETGFTNLQFVGLSALADGAGDHLFQQMLTSIQTDEARHAQMGVPVLETVVRADKAYAQYLIDKWFWRSWLLFSVLTGFSMDYLTPLHARTSSFKEFVEEWIIDQFTASLSSVGLERPWYWDTFVRSIDYYHHMVYLSAYTYRATVWFDMALPSPSERAWLYAKYPSSWGEFDPLWERVTEGWRRADPGVDFAVHGTAIVGFCHLCNLVLCGGTPTRNSAVTLQRGEQSFIFCSEPCRSIFEQQPERYADHKDLVKRVLAGEAPANLLELLTRYCGLSFDDWGKDALGGRYSWLERPHGQDEWGR